MYRLFAQGQPEFFGWTHPIYGREGTLVAADAEAKLGIGDQRPFTGDNTVLDQRWQTSNVVGMAMRDDQKVDLP